MESNQSANGSPAAGKPMTDAAGTGKLNPSMIDVFDQALISLNDRMLDAQMVIRENTAQQRVMANSVELVRGLPAKMTALEEKSVAVDKRLLMFGGSIDKLGGRMGVLEEGMIKLSERMQGLEWSMRQLAEKPTALDAATEVLRAEMRKHAELFEKPQEKTVRHWHYLHYYGWITIGLFCVCMGLAVLWVNARNNADRNATSDILWRGARQLLDSTLLQQLDTVKNRYDANPEEFRKDVIAQDEHNEELAEKLQEAAEKRQEADDKSMEEYRKRQEADEAQKEAEELKKGKAKR
jgi:hypothetical protein